MVIVSAFGINQIGLVYPTQSKLSFYTLQYNAVQFNKPTILQRLPARIAKRCGYFSAAAGRDNQQLNFNDELPSEPFLLSLIKEAVWGLRSLFIFLAEQPSQLKYIEWPSFQSTLKTATLTLILVAMLIVALSSVDSALSYILTSLLRRTT